MHRLFRKALDDATGISEFVIVQNVDIRGFSDWSLEVDSAQTALYIKKVYAKLIDRFFSHASFIKPTGDGLLVVEAFEENDLAEVASRTVKDAIEIVENFASLCSDEDMINFSVPSKVGIGLSRGTASRLSSKTRTLDYSGRVLNLASRLMDLARPRGVVIDGGYGLNLLPEELATLFHQDSAYLKGIAPMQPLPVYCWPDDIEIPPWHKRPLGEERWEHKELTYTLREIQTMSFRRHRVDLDPAPLQETAIEGEVAFPALTPAGNKSTGITYLPIEMSRNATGGAHFAVFDLDDLADRLAANGVKPSWRVTIKVSYQVP